MAATPKEIVNLAAELRSSAELDRVSFEGAARWILDRFIRREQAEAEVAQLREELRGQRCDGSGTLWSLGDGVIASRYRCKCPGCPACKPKAAPISVGPTCLSHDSSGYCETCGSRARESVSTAGELSSSASPAGDAGHLTAPVVLELSGVGGPVTQHSALTIELGPRTLRALLAVLGRSVDYGFDLSLPDVLLAELASSEEK